MSTEKESLEESLKLSNRKVNHLERSVSEKCEMLVAKELQLEDMQNEKSQLIEQIECLSNQSTPIRLSGVKKIRSHKIGGVSLLSELEMFSESDMGESFYERKGTSKE